jgi:hypothetical protein
MNRALIAELAAKAGIAHDGDMEPLNLFAGFVAEHCAQLAEQTDDKVAAEIRMAFGLLE